VLIAGAKASITVEQLPDLLVAAQGNLAPQRAAYERRYELLDETSTAQLFLAEPGHWRDVGEALGWRRREADAAARAHAEQVKRRGRELGRTAEFETALEIREAVVVG
jgi:hypothetical protein